MCTMLSPPAHVPHTPLAGAPCLASSAAANGWTVGGMGTRAALYIEAVAPPRS